MDTSDLDAASGPDDELLRADIARCVDGDPQRRFASAQELAERIETLDERRAQVAGERRQKEKDQRRRRLIRLGGAAMAGLLLLVGGIGVALVREQGLRKETELAQQRSELSDLNERNAILQAEVDDLKKGLAAVEARARSELGLVPDHQVVTGYSRQPNGDMLEHLERDARLTASARPRSIATAASMRAGCRSRAGSRPCRSRASS